MNYGHYYKLNTHNSDLTNGIVVFDYKGIEEYNDGGRHHIYVTIQECGVHFAYHYYKDDESKHLDCDIVTLPLPTNALDHEKMSEAVDECYNVVFPKEIGGIVKEHDPLETRGYTPMLSRKLQEPESDGYIVRKMMLDFLFDIEHSEVFQVSTLFSRIKSVLHENPLTSALFAKAEYEYQRRLQDESTTVLQRSSIAKLVYADNYSRAEQRWVEVLNSPTIDRILAESPWFKSSVTEELNMIYSSKRNGLTSVDYLYGIHSRTEAAKINSIRYRVRQTAKASMDAYLHRYHLTGLFRIWYGKCAWLVAFITLIACVTILFCFIKNADNLIGSDVHPISLLYPFLFLAGIGLLTLPIGRRWRLRPLGILDAMFPRLFAAIVAAWFTIYQHFVNYISGYASIDVNIAMLLLLVVYVYYEIRKKNRYLHFGIVLLRTIPLIAVAFIYSFITGWAMLNVIGCGVEQQNAVSQEQMMMFTTIAVFIGIFIQMLFNNKSITES